jgi:ABC-type Mn2+/Zn2+ transport system permease subunit
MIKIIEGVGVACGITGSFLVARGMLSIGFCLFLVSSVCLVYSAVKQKNWNLTLLQGAFLFSNVLGVSNYVFGY